MKKITLLFVLVIIILYSSYSASAQRPNENEYDKLSMLYHKSPDLGFSYPSLEEVYAFLDSIASQYPEITYLDTSWTSQFLGLRIPVLKISDNPEMEEDEPAIGYDGLIHSKEPVSMLTCIEIIRYLVSNYYINEDVKMWVDNSEIFIIPMLNPDGWKYINDSSLFYIPSWRKNMRDNDNSGYFDPLFDGVDLNRNFDLFWDYGNPNPNNYYYRGPFPFSEKETQLKRKIASEQKYTLSINYHSPSSTYAWKESVIISWKYANVINPDFELSKTIADSIAARIPKFNLPEQYDIEYGPCDMGYSDCWMRAMNGTLEFVIETGPEFFPPDSAPLQIAEANVEGGLYLLNRVFGPGITGHVVNANTLQPISAEIRVVDIDTAQLYVEPRKNDSIFGRFFRLLNPGVYTIEAIADGYDTIKLENIVVNDTLVYLTFNLVSLEEYANNSQIQVKVYPNPIFDKTTIEFSLTKPCDVILGVYNLYGQMIEILLNQRKQNGNHKIHWNTEKLPAGMYYYRIQTGEQAVTGNMVVIK